MVGMRPNRAVVVGAALVCLLLAQRASADITGFVGLSGGPSTRSTWGVAAGVSFLVVGLEFEYADISESFGTEHSPRIRTGGGNLLIQAPALAGVQIYGTAGAGGYHMTWQVAPDAGQLSSNTNVGVNLGGGVKIGVFGPLRVRADYRYFRFMGAPVGYENVHRFYVGANLKF